MTLELFQFQRTAATQIADRYIEYSANPAEVGRRNDRKPVPFYQALSSITGSGKTPILAQAVNEIATASLVAPVVLWLSKGKVVVRQSFANLDTGGKYRHLLGSASVNLLADYDPVEVENSPRPLVYFATVGTFNNRDRESGSLKIFRAEIDTTQATTWDSLKRRSTLQGARRPLLIVYDEAQNLSDQQTELLLELEPNAFLLASATLRFPAHFDSQVIKPLHDADFSDADLVTSVPSSEAVDAGLVKDTVELVGLNVPMEESINQMFADFSEATKDAIEGRLAFRPKAIYVCNTNMMADDARRRDDPRQPFAQRQAPPITIWRHLTGTLGVPPEEIAVYADLATDRKFPLPSNFTLFNGGDGDYERFSAGNYTHVIFNLSLQEGWDDPAAYFAYVDKSMDSRIQVTQVIGRVLRQPGARHYHSQRLNTAHFYVRVDRNNVFGEVIDEVRRGLGGEAPQVRILTTAPGKSRPVEIPANPALQVPRTGIDNEAAKDYVGAVIESLSDYSSDSVNTRGVGRRREVAQRVGVDEGTAGEWEDFEQSSQVAARWIFAREVSRRYRPALTVMNMEGPKFDARMGFGSPAYSHVASTAETAVDTYINHAAIKQIGPNPYTVGPILVHLEGLERFGNSLHEGYDDLNSFELEFARALDGLGKPWCRNPARTGYGIPLISHGPTSTFYPDFLLWDGDNILCLETKGEHLVANESGRKLLSITPNRRTSTRIGVRLISRGRFSDDGTMLGRDGYSVWSLTNGQRLRTTQFGDLAELVASLS